MPEQTDHRGVNRGFACLVGLAMLVAALGLASPSLAQIPPDNSAVDEYTENVPGAGGDESSNNVGNGSGGGPGGGGSLPPDTERELQGAGESGQAAADLAEAGIPASGDSHGEGAGNATDERDGEDAAGGEATVGDTGDEEGSGALASTDADSDEGSGIGPGLPIALALIALGAVAFFIVRRRSEGQPGPA